MDKKNEEVWKLKFKLKLNKSIVSVGEDPPRSIREIRARYLVPAMKKAKEEDKKAIIVGDRLIVDGKKYFQYEIPST